jgi:tRNA (guanine37-N1)-methyltransferase
VRIDVVTIFPEYLAPLGQSLIGKATERGLVTFGIHDLRQWTDDVHRTVDDAPYGGGPGMVMKPEPWGRALDAVRPPGTRLVVPTPAGQPFTQAMAAQWATEPGLVFACGRYEGIDQRVADWAAESGPVSEVSIGDYVLAGGESAALVMIEAVTRLLPGVVGNRESVEFDSHADGLLEGPATTPRSPAGGGRSRCGAPRSAVRTCWVAEARPLPVRPHAGGRSCSPSWSADLLRGRRASSPEDVAQ